MAAWAEAATIEGPPTHRATTLASTCLHDRGVYIPQPGTMRHAHRVDMDVAAANLMHHLVTHGAESGGLCMLKHTISHHRQSLVTGQ